MSSVKKIKKVLSIQSHVVYGHAGNSSGAFPMELLGVEVWPLNTVQFSTHTAYPEWRGTVMSTEHLAEVFDGLQQLGVIADCDAVLSGYLGSVQQGEVILDMVSKVKQANPKAIYFCDPVMRLSSKTGYVASGVNDFFKNEAMPLSNIIAPNFGELQWLAGRELTNLADVILACYQICEQGPEIVMVKHLAQTALSPDHFELLLVAASGEVWHVARPLISFAVAPVGVGDLLSGLLLANLLQGRSLAQALEHTNAAVYEVMLTTQRLQQRELQLVAAQQQIIQPLHHFKATRLAMA